MYVSWTIKNFKSLRDVPIQLNDLNIFIGKNNAGKSSTYHPLILLRSWLPSKIGLWHELSSPHIPEDLVNFFGDYNDLVWLKKRNTPLSFEYKIKLSIDEVKALNEYVKLHPYLSDRNFCELIYRIDLYSHESRTWNIHLQGLYDKDGFPILEFKANYTYHKMGGASSSNVYNPFFVNSTFGGKMLEIETERSRRNFKMWDYFEEIFPQFNEFRSSIYTNKEPSNIIRIAKEGKTEERVAAFSILSELYDSKSEFVGIDVFIPILMSCLNDNDWSLKSFALDTITTKKISYTEEIIQRAFHLLSDSSGIVRFFAARFLDKKSKILDKISPQMYSEKMRKILSENANEISIRGSERNFFEELRGILYSTIMLKTRILLEIRLGSEWNEILQEKPSSVGYYGSNVVQYLAYHFNKREFKTARFQVNKWLERFGGKDLIISLDDVKHLSTSTQAYGSKVGASASVEDPIFNVSLNLSAMGYGFKQLLSIIVECFFSEKGATIIIDEPELHLNPENQMKLVDMLIEVMKEGKQIILVTHSENIFLRLQRRIAETRADGNKTEYLLSSENVNLYYFDKDSKGTKIKKVNIEDDGKIPNWLPGVSHVQEKETELILKAQAKYRSK